MKICPICGMENEDNFKNCELCDFRFDTEDVQLQHTLLTAPENEPPISVNTSIPMIICPSCGNENDGTATFCQF